MSQGADQKADFEIQDRVLWICCTSVDDGMGTLRRETDIEVVKAALNYEQMNRRRVTMLKALKAKLRKLEASK